MNEAVAQSLVAALAANTAVVTENNRLLVEAAAGREQVLAAAEKASAPKAATRAKKEEAPAEAPASAPAAETPAAPPAAAAAAQPDPNDPLNKAIVGWAGGTDRPEERAARMAKVKELFVKVGATSAATVPDDKRQAFINTIAKLQEQGDLVPVEEPAAEAEDDLL
jgi:hypothetical protein